jgi:cation-transporting P-type ATPase C
LAVTGATLVLTRDLAKALAVYLVMSCPCATVLAAATAVSAALANAARNRILIKGGLYLEHFGAVDCVCFDKTGTLTTDQPEVSDVVPRTPWIKPETVVAAAASVELHNPHPVARAIVRESHERGYPPEQEVVSEIRLGRGVRGELSTGLIAVGNLNFMDEQGVDIRYFKGSAKELEEEGRTIVYVAKDGKAQGMIGVMYEVRASADAVMEQLRDDGVSELHLISGDSEQAVQTLSQELGFDGSGWSLLPEDKAHYLERLRSTGRTVAIVGDGVNDAVALSKATVGVAMCAGGAEAAIAAADVALVDDDLARLIFLRRLSHQTLKVVEQNYWLAVSTDLIGAAFAAVGLLTPVMAGAVHVIHTFGIFLNSSRLLGWKPKETKERKPAGSGSTRKSQPSGHMEADQ